jgi:uncharacterized protein
MKAIPFTRPEACHSQAREELAFLESESEFHLRADWANPVFVNYRITAEELQPFVPYELDLYEGDAWVSLVSFTMRGMHPTVGGQLTRMLFRPFREQRFLNVRTYVKVGDEHGIHFIAEWISDWLNAQLGPWAYGLPYRYGHLSSRRNQDSVSARILAADGELTFAGTADETGLGRATAGSLTAFLLERYVEFNSIGGRQRFFRVWHEPWQQTVAAVEISDDSLMNGAFPWWKHVRFSGAHYSPGALDVRMGRPRTMASRPAPHREQEIRPKRLVGGLHGQNVVG